MNRHAKKIRKTSETNISLDLRIDGTGDYTINTPVPFLSHMLELFSRHGLFDVSITAEGDVDVDFHHTVEDIGICLGQALKESLGDKAGITRYGDATVPMDEALASTSLDISGRPFFVFTAPELKGKVGDFDLELVEEFFQAFVANSGITLHIRVHSGRNYHHIIEAVFKSFARALDQATQKDTRSDAIPSTKGSL
jgi:imidazoleglycerol-phosphate dehydratase